MRFDIALKHGSLSSFFRDAGYTPLGIDDKTQELVFSKNLSSGMYPRFHTYCKTLTGNLTICCNLHLDQKKPSYQGVSAHSGEYEGQLLEKEVQRIISITKI